MGSRTVSKKSKETFFCAEFLFLEQTVVHMYILANKTRPTMLPVRMEFSLNLLKSGTCIYQPIPSFRFPEKLFRCTRLAVTILFLWFLKDPEISGW